MFEKLAKSYHNTFMDLKQIGGITSLLKQVLKLRYPEYKINISKIEELSFSYIVNIEIEDDSTKYKEFFKLKDYRYREFYDFISYDEIEDSYIDECYFSDNYERLSVNDLLSDIDNGTIISIHGRLKYKRVIDINNKTISLVPSFLNGKSKFTKESLLIISDMVNNFSDIKSVQDTLKLEHHIDITIPGIKNLIQNK